MNHQVQKPPPKVSKEIKEIEGDEHEDRPTKEPPENSNTAIDHPIRQESPAHSENMLALHALEPTALLEEAQEAFPNEWTIDQAATRQHVRSRSFPSAKDSYKVRQVEALAQRRKFALGLASRFLGRICDPHGQGIERNTHHKFAPVKELLDAVTDGEVVRFEQSEVEGFICGRSYPELHEILLALFTEVRENEIDIPLDFPMWGREERDCQRVWSANSFEILATAYRHEVESYIQWMADYFVRFGDELRFLPPSKGKETTAHKLFFPPRKDSRPPMSHQGDIEVNTVTKDKGNHDLPPHMTSEEETREEILCQSLKPMSLSSMSRPNTGIKDEEGLDAIRRGQSTRYSSKGTSAHANPFLVKPSSITKTRRMSELFGRDVPKRQFLSKDSDSENEKDSWREDKESRTRERTGRDGDGDGPSSSSSDDESGEGGGGRKPPPRVHRKHHDDSQVKRAIVPPRDIARFDLRLKADDVPEWDGNEDSLGLWILKMNALARRSDLVYKQLGAIVPTRLRKTAETWYYSLPKDFRAEVEVHWGKLREVIGSFYMNRTWLEHQKLLANQARFRENGHSTTNHRGNITFANPSLLSLVYSLSDAEIIMEVMSGAPTTWSTILTTHLYSSVIEFQAALKFHEEILLKLSGEPCFLSSGFQLPARGYSNNRSTTYSSSFQNRSHEGRAGWSGHPFAEREDAGFHERCVGKVNFLFSWR